MLKIRKEQMEALAMVSLQEFYNDMLNHAVKYFPEKCRAMGPEAVKEAVKNSMIKAKDYQIETRADICKFINLGFVLGFDFDTNDAYPWAREILNNPDLASSESKMMMLETAALEHLEGK